MTPETLSKLDFIRSNAQLFQRCGSVVASYRTRNGRRFGPYYRLAYLQQRRQRSLYLGRSEILAQQARDLLDHLQEPRNDRRDEKRAERQRKANLLLVKRQWQQTLRAYGLYSRGWDVRGFRARGFPRFDKVKPTRVARPLETRPANPSPTLSTQLSPDSKLRPNRRHTPALPTPHRSRPRYRQNRPFVDQLHISVHKRSSAVPRNRQERLLVDQLHRISPLLPRGPPHQTHSAIEQ